MIASDHIVALTEPSTVPGESGLQAVNVPANMATPLTVSCPADDLSRLRQAARILAKGAIRAALKHRAAQEEPERSADEATASVRAAASDGASTPSEANMSEPAFPAMERQEHQPTPSVSQLAAAVQGLLDFRVDQPPPLQLPPVQSLAQAPASQPTPVP